MAMTIPQHAPNWTMFFVQAKAKGIKIRSRYRGVSPVYVFQRAYWQVQLTRPDGKKEKFGSFPFTWEGEKKAGQAYIDRCHEFGYDPLKGKPNIRNGRKKSENLFEKKSNKNLV